MSPPPIMSPPPSIKAIIETALHSDDLPRSVRFYQEQLGLRPLESGTRLCVFAVAEKQLLLLFQRGGTREPVSTPGGVIPPHDGSGRLHIAFAVSKNEVGAWEKHLTSRGIIIESKVSWPAGGQSLFFRDPDHHLVELATPGVWEVY